MRRTSELGVCRCKFEIPSRTALALSVPILLVVYLAYLITAFFSDAIVEINTPRGSSLDGWHQGSLDAVAFSEPEEVPAAADWDFDREFIVLNKDAPLPNKGRNPGSNEPGSFGTQSEYYGDVQRERQRWLVERAEELRWPSEKSKDVDSKNKTTTTRSLRVDEDMGEVPGALTGFYGEGEGGQGIDRWDKVRGKGGTVNNAGVVRNETVSKYQWELIGQEGDDREKEVYEGEPAAMGEVVIVFPGPRKSAGVMGEANERRRLFLGGGHRGTPTGTLEERIARLEVGKELWGATYVPPIEPTRRQELVDKWSSAAKSGEETGETRGRILYVITSFDRGDRLGPSFRQQDKLDYVLMMFDEMREACEAGFRPQVHLIMAWDPSGIVRLAADRLYCQRSKGYVPFSYEEHPHSIGNGLSIKHRVYMRPRLNDFDVFSQVEDDMMLTLNHIMLFQEESERLTFRRGNKGKPDDDHVPGFIRIEPGVDHGAKGIGEDWFEWEIVLSRFHAVNLAGAGAYIRLGDSKVNKNGGNNQGMWMATRGQLEKLHKKCQYLEFFNYTQSGHVETHSGSLQMFNHKCGLRKVFPATHFEDFLVHHRSNNKNGRRGESIPGVPISMLRVWAQQFDRDAPYLVVVN